MNPRFPIYIVSKGRWESRLTVRALERMAVPYLVVIEEQEHAQYAAVIDRRRLIVLDPAYQRDYDTFDTLGDTITRGSGPARNFAWDHAVAAGHAWHWCVDDNIRHFQRLSGNAYAMADGTAFRCMEDFALRYANLAMVGPAYHYYPRSRQHPLMVNGRVYSCNLIRNDVGFRWRGRYNEDTDLSLRMLKAGWCTVQFFAFLIAKATTLSMKGGNTDELYAGGARKLEKSRMLVAMHPGVARLKYRFGRWHHVVDYSGFRQQLLLRDGVVVPAGADDYGMVLVPTGEAPTVRARAAAAAAAPATVKSGRAGPVRAPAPGGRRRRRG